MTPRASKDGSPGLQRRQVLTLALSSLTPLRFQPSPAFSINVIDAMPAFWDFASAAERAPPAALPALFNRLLVQRHPELYDERVVGTTTVELYWEAVRPHLEGIRRAHEHLVSIMATATERVQRNLPRFRQNVTVYFLASLCNFDGAERTVQGERCVLVGVDYLARNRVPKGSFAPLVCHELFHVYHRWDHNDFTQALWSEGLATYASSVLCPAASLENVLRSAQLARLRPAELARLASAARGRLFALVPDARSGEELFFEARDDNSAVDGIPPRAGYLVGFRAAELLGRTLNLDQLARLDAIHVRVELDRALASLERGTFTSVRSR